MGQKIKVHPGGASGTGQKLRFLYDLETEKTYCPASTLEKLHPPRENFEAAACAEAVVILRPITMGITTQVAAQHRELEALKKGQEEGKATEEDVAKKQEEMSYRLMVDLVARLEGFELEAQDGAGAQELTQVKTREEYNGLPISFVTAFGEEMGALLESVLGTEAREAREGK